MTVTKALERAADALKEAGSTLEAEALADLLLGVLAAPPGQVPRAWQALLDVTPDEGLAETLDVALASLRRPPEPAPDRARRLSALREVLAAEGLDGLLVPRADAHQGEAVPPGSERLAWLTGFDGSAGLAVVLAEQAALFVDGRYTLQARAQSDPEAWQVFLTSETTAEDWLPTALPEGGRLGYDPWLVTPDQRRRLARPLEPAGIELVATEGSLVDRIWPDQPPAPVAPAVPHPLERAGESSAEKRARLAETLVKEKAEAALLTLPDSIAWLTNLRGADVPHTPVPLAFALLQEDGALDLFLDERKLTPEARASLGNSVRLHPYESVGEAVEVLGRVGLAVLLDPASAPAALLDRLTAAGGKAIERPDPCLLPKARKNATELEGMRAAHRRDGAAVVRFLCWLDEVGPESGLGEIEVAARIEGLRAGDPLFRDHSFETISAIGGHAASPHYRATPEGQGHLESGTLYLCDSGGQYLDGTTDITRTVALGEPSEEMRERFTLVLKGHIALSACRFPRGTTGTQLDTLARLPLWRAGLDYEHGTGHGVGAYLAVHEGPARISKQPNKIALEPGMVLSNEPGYYKAGHYGIRTETLIVVTELPEVAGQDKPMLGFETLTLAPYDRRLIVVERLTADELAFVEAYHAHVRRELSPLLDGRALAWLEAATAPLA